MAHVTVSIFCGYITLLLCHFRLCSPPRCSITAMSQWEEEIFSGLSCIDPRGAVHLQSSGQLFFSARSGQNNPEWVPLLQGDQSVVTSARLSLNWHTDGTAHTTPNWPQLLPRSLHPGVCLLPIRWDKLSPPCASTYLCLFFSATTVTCSRVVWLVWLGEMFIQLTACYHVVMLADFVPCV